MIDPGIVLIACILMVCIAYAFGKESDNKTQIKRYEMFLDQKARELTEKMKKK